MNAKEGKTIAVDFDGTIVTNAYPGIAKPLLFAFDTLKKLQNEGHQLILWTYRAGDRLQEAVDFCAQQGIIFYAVNKSYPEEEYSEKVSRKIHADIFIDDRDITGMKGWGEIYHILSGERPSKQSLKKPKKEKKGIFSKLEDLFKED